MDVFKVIEVGGLVGYLRADAIKALEARFTEQELTELNSLLDAVNANDVSEEDYINMIEGKIRNLLR